MKPLQFLQNFNMNEELHISGTMIFNGLSHLHGMQAISNNDEVFEVLYCLSIGFERLLKVAIVLIEGDNVKDQEEFEKSLITHNHQDLLNRLNSSVSLNVTSHQNSFMQFLARFYNRFRYDRYCLDTVSDCYKEVSDFQQFLSNRLEIDFPSELDLNGTQEMYRIRKFIGRVCKALSTSIYKLIKNTARNRNIYTYEIRHGSKASKIFMYKEYDFQSEDIVTKEVLLYLIKSPHKKRIDHFLSNLDPLELEECDVLEAIDEIRSNCGVGLLRDSIETFYNEMKNVSDRIEQLKLLGRSLNYMILDDEEVDFDDYD